MTHSPTSSPAAVVAALKQQIAQLNQPGLDVSPAQLLATGTPLDRLLPGGGFRRGTLVEWLSPSTASGGGSSAATLALATAGKASQQGGQALVVIDRARHFYPPAAAAAGIDLSRTLIVQPEAAHEEPWILDQVLRCPVVGAVLVWDPGFSTQTLRRMQLAVEEARAVGLLIRPWSTRGMPSWADLRLLVSPLPARVSAAGEQRRLRVELLRVRNGHPGGCIDLQYDHEADGMRLVS